MYKSTTFSEKIYAWLLDEKPVNYKISDIYVYIFIDEGILIDKRMSKHSIVPRDDGLC